MAKNGIRILTVSDYLDIWRGAFYSVMLGMVYNSSVLKSLSQYSISFAILVSVYLINDGMVRYKSRELVRTNWLEIEKDLPIFWEVLWLILEITGLLLFVVWGTYVSASMQISLNERLSAYSAFVGWFCIVNCTHNTFIIQADKGIDFLRFTLVSILGDASEIYRTSKQWANYLIETKNKALENLEYAESECIKAQNGIIEEFKEKIRTSFKMRYILGLFKTLPHEALKYVRFGTISFKLGFVHVGVQFTALHVVAFNFMAGLVIILTPSNGVFPKLLKSWPYFFLPVLISIVLYSITSYFEMERMKQKKTKPFMYEKITQCLGNLFLVAFFFFWFLSLPKHAQIIVILAEGGIFAFLLLLLAKPAKT